MQDTYLDVEPRVSRCLNRSWYDAAVSWLVKSPTFGDGT